MANQASVNECEDYIEQHGIQGILKDVIAKICQDRPENHFKWLREHFERLEKVGLAWALGREHTTRTHV